MVSTIATNEAHYSSFTSHHKQTNKQQATTMSTANNTNSTAHSEPSCSTHCYTCVLCDDTSAGYGNNPDPLATEGLCCDTCNFTKVIPARFTPSPSKHTTCGIQDEMDECGECVICEEAQIDPSESALCFVPNGEIDLDDALYPRDLDWGFDKPDVPYDTIYIFNKEEGDTTSDCISQYWQGIDLGSVLCHRRANMSWDEDKPDAPHTTVYIFDKEEEDEDE